MLIKNESAAYLCRDAGRGCLCNCRGCKAARIFNLEPEIEAIPEHTESIRITEPYPNQKRLYKNELRCTKTDVIRH